MRLVNREALVDALQELSDESYQWRIWCRVDESDPEMSSFSEAIERCFGGGSGSGLGYYWDQSSDPAFQSPKLDKVLRQLRREAAKIDDTNIDVKKLVSSNDMQNIRHLAQEALQQLTIGEAKVF